MKKGLVLSFTFVVVLLGATVLSAKPLAPESLDDVFLVLGDVGEEAVAERWDRALVACEGLQHRFRATVPHLIKAVGFDAILEVGGLLERLEASVREKDTERFGHLYVALGSLLVETVGKSGHATAVIAVDGRGIR